MNRFPPKATYKRSADKEKASIIKTIIIVSVTRKATIKTNVGEDVKKQHFPNFCWEFKMVCFGKFWQLLKKFSYQNDPANSTHNFFKKTQYMNI